MEFKKPKLFGKDEDGFYLGAIEQIETQEDKSILCISSTTPDFKFFYRQIGTFEVKLPHDYFENEIVVVEKKDGKIVAIF